MLLTTFVGELSLIVKLIVRASMNHIRPGSIEKSSVSFTLHLYLIFSYDYPCLDAFR